MHSVPKLYLIKTVNITSLHAANCKQALAYLNYHMEFHASCPNQSLEYWENVLDGRSSWESSLGALEVPDIYFDGRPIINP